MGSKQVRIAQLIAPFGPGSIYTDRKGVPHAICGLDHWFKRSDPNQGLLRCDNPKEFDRFEPRLSALLGIDRFCTPPDYRMSRAGQEPPPNAWLSIPAVRFPRWYRQSRTGEMRCFNLHTTRLDNPPGGGRWLPVRFIAACEGGHLCEFPWKEWIGCVCRGNEGLRLTDRGGSELGSIHVQCLNCPPGSSGHRGKSLQGTTARPDAGEKSAFEEAGIRCPGERPWLGDGAQESNCQHPLVATLINQTNLYFPRTISAISLPDLEQPDEAVTGARNDIEQDQAICGIARTVWNMPNQETAIAMVQNSLQQRGLSHPPELIREALTSLFSSVAPVVKGAAIPVAPESSVLQFRRAEFNIIRNEVNDPDKIPNLRVVPSRVPAELKHWISKINLVERLRETRVFYGFDRLEPASSPLADMPMSALRQLFRTVPSQPTERWLPAIEVFGEGIYLELDEKSIQHWQSENKEWLEERLDDAFLVRLAGEFKTLPPDDASNRDWASRYLLVHTFAHILINQLVFDCGYSTAALRERLYISADPVAPMAGVLVYTAAGDSEGTLGGLVRLGRPDRFLPVVQRALSRASWCSADPICSEHLGGKGARLANLAACHACVLLPETSCETINQGLDRAMIVGTPEARDHGFMRALFV